MATRSFATFTLNDHLFGIDILLVREINKQLDVTNVPKSPDYIRGLINLRGQIVTILNLGNRLGLDAENDAENSYNIILKTESELDGVRRTESRSDLASCPDKVGLLVESIQDVITVEEDAINPPPANRGRVDGRYLSGVVSFNHQLVSILALDKVLSQVEN
jgi:purine-binding chemotaxis protein CheW